VTSLYPFTAIREMKKILLFGAGKSATCLIRYLVTETALRGWQLIVAESNLSLAQSKIGSAGHARAVSLQVENEQDREALVGEADIVISLLPPALHFLVAQSCVTCKKDLLTASYLDDKMRSLEQGIRENSLLFLCEMGLDPGIDHMSAMQLIHSIKEGGGKILSFRSHTGGLVSPESDDNPWHYKISWNPRNVVMAGSAGARYRENDQVITMAYEELFSNCQEVNVDGIGRLAWYPNRDSLGYLTIYALEDTKDFVRTTLRYPSFCRGWKSIVRAGLTNDQAIISSDGLTYARWSAAIVPFIDMENKAQLEFLGLFDHLPVPASTSTSADVLQHLLETKLAMRPEDKDMIVMLHEIAYTGIEPELPGTGKAGRPDQGLASRSPHVTGRKEVRSTLVVHGDDHLQTAMAKTVGLPLGIAAIFILEGKIRLKGLHIPILPAIYEPVLKALAEQGIRFAETWDNR
jgi:saccharopine dehydrogenase-like NADP-dependent oxidoreductase